MLVDDALKRYEVTDSGCWRWNAAIASTGYGVVKIGGAVRGAHRLFYQEFVGTIPDELVIDHLCHNRWCVNPHHMEPVTRGENVRRGKALIVECPQGHPYDRGNTGIRGEGHRYCRACARDRMRNRRR